MFIQKLEGVMIPLIMWYARAFRVIKVKALPIGLAGGLVKRLFLLITFQKSFRGLPPKNTFIYF
jgi:hypothetical protein